MIRSNSIGVLLVAIVGIVTVAQPQPTHTISCDPNCLQKKHKYIFCTVDEAGTARDKFICVENPHTTVDPETGRPIKHYHPSLNSLGLLDCFIYDESTSYLTLGGGVYQPLRYDMPSPFGTDVFMPRPADIRSDIEKAIRAWTSCCDKTDGTKLSYTSSTWPSGVPPDGNRECCLVIYWSSDAADFRVPDQEDAIAKTWRYGQSPNSCEGVNCDKFYKRRARILLNQSSSFRNGTIGQNNIPKRFFVNRDLPTNIQGRMETAGYEYFDFITMLVHEFGHVFGMEHDDGDDDNGNDCENDPSVMQSTVVEWEKKREVTRPNDCCRFQKIYCCAETTTSVIEDFGQKDDPSVALCGECEDGSIPTSLRLYDLNGRLLGSHPVPLGMKLAQIGAYVHTDPGVYLCVAELPTGSKSFKILVSR